MMVDKIRYVIFMLGSAGAMFVMAAGLSDPFFKLVLAFNNKGNEKSVEEWAVFIGMATFFGCLWLFFYLIFKYCEKRLIDIHINGRQRNS